MRRDAASFVRARAWLIAALLFGAAAAAWWWTRPADPEAELRARWSPLARLERVPAPELGRAFERWRLVTAAGDTARGLWRAAGPGGAERAGPSRPWTVVMMGGLDAGEGAALLIPPELSANVLAMAWPWPGPRRLSALGLLLRLGAIREAALRSPAVLALGAEAAAREPDVDRARVALLGASLGVPPAVAALQLTREPDALVLVDGAADLERLLDAGLCREGCPRPLAGPLASLANRMVLPLEPALNARAAGGRRVLLINAAHDQLLPRRAIERLHAAFTGAEIRWRAGAHIDARQRSTTAATAREVEDWLERAPDGARDDVARPAVHSLERSPRRIDLIARRRPSHDAGP